MRNHTTNWDNYEHYDDRQDIDGSGIAPTILNYGSDEAWDQLDPDVYQIKRYDSTNEEWYTREEFFREYNSNEIWDEMSAIKHLMRQELTHVYKIASELPHNIQLPFIRDYMSTFDN